MKTKRYHYLSVRTVLNSALWYRYAVCAGLPDMEIIYISLSEVALEILRLRRCALYLSRLSLKMKVVKTSGQILHMRFIP